MNFLKRIFGIDSSKSEEFVPEKKQSIKKEVGIEMNKGSKKIPENILIELLENDTSVLTESIKEKRKKNNEKYDNNIKRALELIGEGKSLQAQRLSEKDVQGFYEYYVMAENEEKSGNLKEAANIYWYNIFHNGTDAPANFTRLMILLRKMDEFELELKVANLFKNFVHHSDIDKLEKRIATIQKKINK